ncbi:MAG: SufD family Fe-S cluster assembly protein [Treponema sp.]|nr:SufD family Fe-S cluster assembly protein [Treponema sp.]
MTDTLQINNLPTLTWNWLKINSTPYTYNDHVTGNGEPRMSALPKGVLYNANASAESDAYYHLETGCGKNLDAQFLGSHVQPVMLTVQKGVCVEQPILINFELADNSDTAASYIIKAETGSDVTVIMLATSAKDAGGSQVLRTICDAGNDARIHLVKVQLLGKQFVQIDDIGVVCGENGCVELTHVILGGKETYTGAAATLSSYKSSFISNTAYLCRESQKLDMNYIARHRAKKTTCSMSVKGTLQDDAQKTYRGSIDFQNGCSGAEGQEMEETLLLSPRARNKSIPLILCDEEDVAGEHGATIGKLGEDVLFYMQSRGIAKADAEKIMARAKIASVAALIKDDAVIEKINTYLDEAFSHE